MFPKTKSSEVFIIHFRLQLQFKIVKITCLFHYTIILVLTASIETLSVYATTSKLPRVFFWLMDSSSNASLQHEKVQTTEHMPKKK